MFQRTYNKKKSDNFNEAVNYLLKLLTRREYSKLELQKKLNVKFTAEVSIKALEYCIERNYQSDERYAQMLLDSYKNNCYGPLKYRYVAYNKGIDKDLISNLIEDVNWDELAFLLLQRKYGDLVLEHEEKIKALNFLNRRGFSQGTCVKAMKRFCNQI